uniref:Uncharacterized protein n=2 Tax=Amorphochlora amoebiformis TaxID=1561963 RepID=A0A7S0D5A8_9EUKA
MTRKEAADVSLDQNLSLNQINLELQSLAYEKAHLKSQIQACRSFKLDLPKKLISIREFRKIAPDDIKTLESKNHAFQLARLRTELEERKKSLNTQKSLGEEVSSLEEKNKSSRKFLDNLKTQILAIHKESSRIRDLLPEELAGLSIEGDPSTLPAKLKVLFESSVSLMRIYSRPLRSVRIIIENIDNNHNIKNSGEISQGAGEETKDHKAEDFDAEEGELDVSMEIETEIETENDKKTSKITQKTASRGTLCLDIECTSGMVEFGFAETSSGLVRAWVTTGGDSKGCNELLFNLLSEHEGDGLSPGTGWIQTLCTKAGAGLLSKAIYRLCHRMNAKVALDSQMNLLKSLKTPPPGFDSRNRLSPHAKLTSFSRITAQKAREQLAEFGEDFTYFHPNITTYASGTISHSTGIQASFVVRIPVNYPTGRPKFHINIDKGLSSKRNVNKYPAIVYKTSHPDAIKFVTDKRAKLPYLNIRGQIEDELKSCEGSGNQVLSYQIRTLLHSIDIVAEIMGKKKSAESGKRANIACLRPIRGRDRRKPLTYNTVLSLYDQR